MTKGAYFYLFIFYLFCKTKQDDAEQLTTIIVVTYAFQNNNYYCFEMHT